MNCIDADKLLEKRLEIKHGDNYLSVVFVDDIINAPNVLRAGTVDAQWKYYHSYNGKLDCFYYVCSNCREIVKYKSKYCPSCGARMDLE